MGQRPGHASGLLTQRGLAGRPAWPPSPPKNCSGSCGVAGSPTPGASGPGAQAAGGSVAGTAPSGWGGNTAGILKIKGLETVAWPSGRGAGWGPDRDNGMPILGGCPPTGSSQGRRAPYSLPHLNSAALPRTLPLAYPQQRLRCLLSTYYVPGLRDRWLGTSSLSLSQPCRSPQRCPLLRLRPQAG